MKPSRDGRRGKLMSSALSPSTRSRLESKLKGKICINQYLLCQYKSHKSIQLGVPSPEEGIMTKDLNVPGASVIEEAG